MGKHFKLEITGEIFSYRRDSERIAGEAALDGAYVIHTSVPACILNAEEPARWYKHLSAVDPRFSGSRSLKTVCPVCHSDLSGPDQVQGHILLCMLAYYEAWLMRRDLAPILLDGYDPGDQATRPRRTRLSEYLRTLFPRSGVVGGEHIPDQSRPDLCDALRNGLHCDF